MSRLIDGGPAFPRAGYEDRSSGSMSDGDRVVDHENGMSLRDWFAGQALAGLVASPNCPAPEFDEHVMAKSAYVIADAMLAARSKS